MHKKSKERDMRYKELSYKSLTDISLPVALVPSIERDRY